MSNGKNMIFCFMLFYECKWYSIIRTITSKYFPKTHGCFGVNVKVK